MGIIIINFFTIEIQPNLIAKANTKFSKLCFYSFAFSFLINSEIDNLSQDGTTLEIICS